MWTKGRQSGGDNAVPCRAFLADHGKESGRSSVLSAVGEQQRGRASTRSDKKHLPCCSKREQCLWKQLARSELSMNRSCCPGDPSAWQEETGAPSYCCIPSSLQFQLKLPRTNPLYLTGGDAFLWKLPLPLNCPRTPHLPCSPRREAESPTCALGPGGLAL